MAIRIYSSYSPPPPPPYSDSPPSRTASRARSTSRSLMPFRNRSLSIRSRKGADASSEKSGHRHRFTMASLRGMQQADLSKKLYKLIKSENHVISAYETAGRERASVASQLSEWGDETGDDAISDISDKMGVLLAEIAEQEDIFVNGLEESRGVLKQIRNTESSVQPSRDNKAKVQDEIQKLKYKDPTSTKIVQLEQELVRAEAQSLVAEAQLTNITRQKLKEAYDIHTRATIERAEKQLMLAKQARRLLNLLDDTPIVPGDTHPPFENTEAARQVLNDAEEELRNWRSDIEPIRSSAHQLSTSGVGTASVGGESVATGGYATSEGGYSAGTGTGVNLAAGGYGGEAQGQVHQGEMHPAYRKDSPPVGQTVVRTEGSGAGSGMVETSEGPAYAITEPEARY